MIFTQISESNDSDGQGFRKMNKLTMYVSEIDFSEVGKIERLISHQRFFERNESFLEKETGGGS